MAEITGCSHMINYNVVSFIHTNIHTHTHAHIHIYKQTQTSTHLEISELTSDSRIPDVMFTACSTNLGLPQQIHNPDLCLNTGTSNTTQRDDLKRQRYFHYFTRFEFKCCNRNCELNIFFLAANVKSEEILILSYKMPYHKHK